MTFTVEIVRANLDEARPFYEVKKPKKPASSGRAPRPKIDLTGRDHGDFIVLELGEPVVGYDGKKKARWVCQCKTCGTKELIRGDYIRKESHKYCDTCFANRPDMVQFREEKVKELNELAQRCGVDISFTPDSFLQLSQATRGIEIVD